MRRIACFILFIFFFNSSVYIPTISPESFDIKWSIHQGSDGYNPSSSCAVAADVIDNGVGSAGKPILELFYAGRNYTACYRGDSGARIWSYWYYSSSWNVKLAIDDINNNGDKELVVFTYEKIICLDAATGELLWTYILPNPTRRLDKAGVIVDVDGTGYKYIFAAAQGYGGGQNEPTTIKLNHLGQLVAQNNFDAYTCWGGIAAADLDGDGIVEIVQTHRRRWNYVGEPGYSAYGGVTCMRATDLTIKWNVNWIACSSHPPSIADVNNDGILDVIVGYQGPVNNRGVWVLRGDLGAIINGANNTGINVWFDMAIYDIDNDGRLELLSSMSTSEGDPTPHPTKIFDLVTFQTEAVLPHPIRVSPSIGNVDADMDMEIITTSAWGANSQGMTIYKYVNGNYIQIFQELNNVLFSSYGDIIVLDVDGDDYNEIITAFAGSYLMVCIETNAIASNPSPRASSSYSNERRTKVSEYVPPPEEEPEIPSTITLISPNGGETWYTENTYTITWTSQNLTDNVTIQLYKNNIPLYVIETNTPNDGNTNWTIPPSTPPGTDYKIKITSVNNNTVTDSSDSTFTILNPLKTFTIEGPPWGLINTLYSFYINLSEPSTEILFIKWDWGDGTITEWLGPFSAEDPLTATHQWSQKGTYAIRGKVKDLYGQESNWSNPHLISIHTLKKTLIIGRYINETKQDGFITIEAVKLRIIQFNPYLLKSITTPTTITFSDTYYGIKTKQFLIGLFNIVE